jgi:hypothetical protein
MCLARFVRQVFPVTAREACVDRSVMSRNTGRAAWMRDPTEADNRVRNFAFGPSVPRPADHVHDTRSLDLARTRP